MKRIILKLVLIGLFLGTSLSAAENNQIVLQGSTTVLPIAQKAAEAFMQKNPKADISVRGGGSGTGIAALIDGICDIADASRPMKKKEVLKAKERGVNPIPFVIAKDGIAVIVHPSNPVSKLSLSQIKDIYTGKISNWSRLGGRNQKIVVISRDIASGTYETFNELVLKKEKVRADALRQASNLSVANIVSRVKGSIGYVGLGYLSRKLKALSVNGVKPSTETVVKDTYPISRPLFMYTNGKPKGLVKNFINFVMGRQGQRIVKEVGFVSVN